MVIRISKSSAQNASRVLTHFLSIARGRAMSLRIVARDDRCALVAATEADRLVVPLDARAVVPGEIDVALKAGLDILCCLDGSESLLTLLGGALLATTLRGLAWTRVGAIRASSPVPYVDAPLCSQSLTEGASPCAY